MEFDTPFPALASRVPAVPSRRGAGQQRPGTRQMKLLVVTPEATRGRINAQHAKRAGDPRKTDRARPRATSSPPFTLSQVTASHSQPRSRLAARPDGAEIDSDDGTGSRTRACEDRPSARPAPRRIPPSGRSSQAARLKSRGGARAELPVPSSRPFLRGLVVVAFGCTRQECRVSSDSLPCRHLCRHLKKDTTREASAPRAASSANRLSRVTRPSSQSCSTARGRPSSPGSP